MPYTDSLGVLRDDQGNPISGQGAPMMQMPNAPQAAPGAPAPAAVPAAPVAPQVAGTPARGGGQYTPEERAYLFQKMPEITAGEEQVARMNAMSEELRGVAAPQRGKMDWASQGARALSGFGSGLAANKAKEQRSAMSGQLRDLGKNWPGQKKPLTDEDYGLTAGWDR